MFLTRKHENAKTKATEPPETKRCRCLTVDHDHFRSGELRAFLFRFLPSSDGRLTFPFLEKDRPRGFTSFPRSHAPFRFTAPLDYITRQQHKKYREVSTCAPFELDQLCELLLFSRYFRGRRARATRAPVKHGGGMGP